MTAEQLLQRLEGVKAQGDGRWMTRCPCPTHAHGDRKQRLSVAIGEQGLVIKCHAGGETKTVLSALGLTMKDLFFEKTPLGARPCRESIYSYRDEKGELLYQTVRTDLQAGKKIFQRRPDPTKPNGWINKLGDVRRVPYRLPELMAAKAEHPVFIVEGEKNVEDLLRAGLVATTNPMGAGKWRQDFNGVFQGRHVVVLPDNDPPGRAHGSMVANQLHQVATSLRVLDLPGLAEKGDVSDWIAAGGVAAQLVELVRRCPLWRPPSDPIGETPNGKDREKPTQAQLLVGLARKTSELFKTGDGEAFAAVERDQTWPVRSEGFRLFLIDRFYSIHGKAPTAQALKEAFDTLEAIANRRGRTEIVALRVGEHAGKVFIDLCDNDHRIVEIGRGEWRVIRARDAPIRFRRSSTALPLPEPQRGRSVDDIRRFVNTGPDEWRWRLALAWLLYTLQPRGPFPLLVLQGERGSAKSTTARVLRALVDPSRARLRLPPKDEDRLLIAAKGSWMLTYDNLSGMPAWLSDALCCLATGTAYTKRSLYTDDEEHVIEAIRPVMINGIDDMTSRPDFASRALSIELPQIAEQDRREEAEFFDDFERELPFLTGALYTALAEILAARGTVTISCRPRMADFARFGVATEVVLGWPPGSFLVAYQESQADSAAVALEADLVAVAVTLELDLQSWRGTNTDLLPLLTHHLSSEQAKSRGWPTTASQLGNRLLRAAPVLRSFGTHLERLRSRGERVIVLSRIAVENRGKAPSPPATPAQAQKLPTVTMGSRVAPRVAPNVNPTLDAAQGDGGWQRGDGDTPADSPAQGDGDDGGDGLASLRSEETNKESAGGGALDGGIYS